MVFTGFPLKGAATTGRAPPPRQGRKAGEDGGGGGLLVRVEPEGGLVLNLEQLMKGNVTEISPISSLFLW